MKGKKYLFIGLVFGVLIGWALGFLRLPYLEKDFSFLLGFIEALALIALIRLLLTARKPRLTDPKNATADSSTPPYNRILLTGMLLLGGAMLWTVIYRRNESNKLQIQNQVKQMHEMAEMLASVQKSDFKPLLRSLLDDVVDELKRNPGRTLSDTTIARIANLSFACKPYRYIINSDSLSNQTCSPERGQLLQALMLMNIDTVSFGRIKQKTLFAFADMRGTDAKGLDLHGINLRQANLEGVDLSGANLQGADLGEANLGGANLNRANLHNANLEKTDLRWAQFNDANLTRANLNSTNLSNGQLVKADMTHATFRYAQSAGALFNEAIMTNADLQGTYFAKANFRLAELSETDLRSVDLSEADIVGTIFDRAVVIKAWPEELKKWQPTGMKEMQERYATVSDTIDKFKRPMYRLKKIE